MFRCVFEVKICIDFRSFVPYIIPNMKIFHEFKNNLLKKRLVKQGDLVVVGVSGGSDSIALLHLLKEVSEKHRFNMVVAHVNYHTRGNDSNADEALVHKNAKELGLECFVKDAARNSKGNFESYARRVRYDFFESLREKLHAESIAVAHTQDDQAETLLMHFLKGAGLEGMAGMQPREQYIVRPVLPFTKVQLREYLKVHRLEYREDSSNADNTLVRNNIRNVLIPDLQKYNANLVETLNRNAGIFSEVNTYMQLEAAKHFKDLAVFEKHKVSFDTKEFELLAKPIAREVLHLAFKKLGHDEPLSHKHFEQVYKVVTQPVSRKRKEISSDLKVTRLRDVILLERLR